MKNSPSTQANPSAVYQFYQSEISQQSIDQLLVFDFGQHLVAQNQKPMEVSEFKITKILPEELKSSLPTIEEIEQTLK